MGFRSMLYNIIGGPSRDEILRESLQLLTSELQQERRWIDISGDTNNKDFGVEDRRTISSQALLYFVKNPLIGLAVTLKSLFVFSRGPSVKAKDPLISEVIIDDFWNDPDNKAELTSLGAMQRKGNTLQLEGNLFLALFVNLSTGKVKIGSIPPTEIDEIITHPENRSKVLWYKRTFTPQKFDYTNGHYAGEGTKTLYYKDWRNTNPDDDILGPPDDKRAKTTDGQEILVCHLKVNCTDQQKFGFSETYRAHPWAKAYTDFLSDLASIWRTLSIFAAERRIPKGTRAQIAKAAAEMRTHAADGTQQRTKPAAGGVRVSNDQDQWVPIKTSGLTMSADDGRRLLLMVCAAMGVYEHYFGDGSNANLASTTAMELPMLKMFEARQALFEDLFRELFDFVIRQSAKASGGKLRKYAEFNEDKSKLTLMDPTTGEEISQMVNVDFPPITQKDVVQLIGALKQALTLDGNSASSTPLITARDAARECMTILGMDNVDELLEQLYPEGGGAGVPDDLSGLFGGLVLPPADQPLPAQEAAVVRVMEQLRKLRDKVEAAVKEVTDEPAA